MGARFETFSHTKLDDRGNSYFTDTWQPREEYRAKVLSEYDSQCAPFGCLAPLDGIG